jgi:hypothetical protein
MELPWIFMARFCCEGSCARVDTTLYGFSPQYISMVSPNPFNPQLYDNVEIVYQVPNDEKVSVRIYDQSNRLVKELARDGQRKAKTAYCERWDGKIWDGSYAANGNYFLAIELSSGGKQVYSIFIKRQ